MKPKCKYLEKCNGDDIEDTNYCDYYTCGKMNELDLLKYHYYSSLENMVDEDNCELYLGNLCMFKKEILEKENR